MSARHLAAAARLVRGRPAQLAHAGRTERAGAGRVRPPPRHPARRPVPLHPGRALSVRAALHGRGDGLSSHGVQPLATLVVQPDRRQRDADQRGLSVHLQTLQPDLLRAQRQGADRLCRRAVRHPAGPAHPPDYRPGYLSARDLRQPDEPDPVPDRPGAPHPLGPVRLHRGHAPRPPPAVAATGR